MHTIDHATFTTLASRHGFPSISLYLPTHRVGAEKAQDPIRLRNLLAKATDALVGEGVRRPDAEALLAEARRIESDESFWRGALEGLAIFASPEDTRILRVDVSLPEQFVVGNRFYLRPLALAYGGVQHFFALALDRGRARLFEGDSDSVREIPLDPAVASFAEVAKYDEREESLQFTTHASPESTAGAGAPIGMFHGHGGENVDKDELLRFVSGLEKAVSSAIGIDSNVPLLLLGVGYQLAAYRSVNTYRWLAPEQVETATDEISEHDLHQKALDALEPRFSAAVAADLRELEEKSSALVSSDPAEIVSAAASGRVKTLFFDESTGPFGVFDRDVFAVESLCTTAPRYLRETADSEFGDGACGWDLVDLAAAETALHGGTIHAFDGENAPVTGVAAVLRY